MSSDEERRAKARRNCTRFVTAYARPSIVDDLTALAAYAGDREPDLYGSGRLTDDIEHRVAGLLGKEAAVFLPSGTMGQQIALRVWADETGMDTVALHGLSHLEIHEESAAWEMHGLRQRFLTREPRLPTVDDLAAIPERLGAVTVELPLRAADYALPPWDDLVAFCAAARDRGARVHLDGARLWETTVHFGHDLAAVAGLADSVYVSFYKVLGGISGSAVAGPASFIQLVRRWQQRHGGRIVTQYPAILSALRGLDEILPEVPAYVARAREWATALAEVEGLRVNPNPPHCNGFVVYADVPTDALRDAALAYAEDTRTWPHIWFPAGVPGWSAAECVARDTTMEWTPSAYTEVVTDVLDRARSLATSVL